MLKQERKGNILISLAPCFDGYTVIVEEKHGYEWRSTYCEWYEYFDDAHADYTAALTHYGM